MKIKQNQGEALELITESIKLRVHSTAEGTHPSDVASAMFSSWTGRWREDLLPRMHRIAERRIAKERRQRIHPMMTEYSLCSFLEIPSANLL